MPSLPIAGPPAPKRILLAALLSLATLCAQTDRGSLTGTVSDISGGLVRGARMEAVNRASHFVWRTTSGNAGQYAIPNLPPGVYDLAIEAPGFKKSVRSAIRIDVGESIRADARLEPGAVIESVEIVAPPVLLETETSETGTLLPQGQVIDFPLSFSGGRSPEDFAYKLAPGAQGDNWMSRVNGSPAFSKEVLLDGASVTTYIAGHFGESSVSLEALEEFRVQTSGYSAEFGRTAGGIFNFVMKSGGNQLHGSAMGQLRNEWMDANSFLNNAYGRPRARDRRHNYAFSLGGPPASRASTAARIAPSSMPPSSVTPKPTPDWAALP